MTYSKITCVLLVSFWLTCESVGADDLLPDGKTASNKTTAKSTATPAPILDTIFLKSGGRLRGKVISQSKSSEDGRLYVVIETETGGLLKLDSSRLIQRTHLADQIDSEYRRIAKIAADDPDLHWKVYQWCKDQDSGSIRFEDQLRYHLQRIVELDANDERARRRLGYDLVEGKWILKKQLFVNHGYVKQGTGWAPEMQTELSARLQQQKELEGAKKRAFDRWLRNIKKPGAPVSDLTQELFQICDEIALPIILHQQAKDEKNPKLRAIYVEAFGRVATPTANQALCYFAIQDPDPSIRERALTLLGQDHYDKATSASYIGRALKGEHNEYVIRASFALGELGATSAILPLVESLQTTHTVGVTGSDAGRMNTSFGDGGSGLQTGGGKKAVKQVFNNDSVVIALKKITDQDFGFNETAWKRWYLENFTLYDIDVRGDE